MYLYFNSKGVLEEVVNDIPTRKDSSNVNHIYVYIDGVAYNTDDKYYPLPDSIESLSTRYQLPDGTITPVALVQGKVQQSIPYDKHRDMKCFKDFYNYEFFDIELPSGVNEDGSQSEIPNVLGQSGLVALTIIEQPVGLTLGLVVFNVEQEVGITTDTLITEAQFNYLMGYVAKYDKQVSDIKTLIPDGTTENNKLTNTTIVQDMIDANIPTFTNSTIWTKDFISKVAKVGYAIYLPNNTMYSVFNADDSNIELQLSNASGLVLVSYDISVGQTILQATTSEHNLVETIDGRIPNITSVVELNDAANKGFVLEQISNVETEIESLGQYAQNTQQELNELKASLYGYVFGEDTANFSKLDISALPSMINNNNVAYNTRLMLDTIKGRTVKWTQLVNPEHFSISQTINGMTFTVDKTKGTITCNGTTTAATSLYVNNETSKIFQATPNDIICLKGCPSGGSASTYYLAFYGTTYNDFGSGVYDKLSNRRANTTDTINTSMAIAIEIASGVTMTNKVFRPQLFNVSNIYGLGKEPKTITDFNKDYLYRIYPYGKQKILTTKVSGIKIRAGYKNLCDKDKFKIKTKYTHNGLTMTNNNDGTVTINGTSTSFSILPIQDIEFDTSHIYYASPNLQVNYGSAIDGGGTAAAIVKLVGTPIVSNKFSNAVYYSYPTNITQNNVTYTPQIVDLTLTYGVGNEPKTLAQFNKDFPNIDNIPYPEQTISFAEQTLYGINDISKTKDELNIVKKGNVYELQFTKRMSVISDISLRNWEYLPNNSEYGNCFRLRLDNSTGIQETWDYPTILCPKYISMVSGWMQEYKYNKLITNSLYYFYIIDKDYTDVNSFKEANKGVPLYYTLANPTTTTIATLTKNQVTALFAKGYCVEILGNDDNNIIVRPDLSLNMVIKLIGGNTNE